MNTAAPERPQRAERKTVFSACRRYRYTLWREWGMQIGLTEDPHLDYYTGRHDQYVQFVCLNPSTADETLDDPTVRRCTAFAQRWGFGAFCMTNLFGFRSTDPNGMRRVHLAEAEDHDPKRDDDENIRCLLKIARSAGMIVAAWGKDGRHNEREESILARFGTENIDLHCLGTNKDGTPKHPLYLRADTLPVLWKTKRNDEKTEAEKGALVQSKARR